MKMSKTTNKAQYEKLLQLMLGKSDVAHGYTKASKEELTLFWEKVKCELDALGPPTKEAMVWRKVWLDWKCYIKRKLVENKKEINATGGGTCRLHTFSKLEEDVIQLAGLQTSTSGIKNAYSFGCGIPIEREKQTEAENTMNPELDNPSLDVSMSSDRGLHKQNALSTTRKVDDTAELLRKQIDLQNSFYSKPEKYYEEQIVNAKRIYRGIDKLCDLKRTQIEETRKHHKIQEELLQKKIEIKLKMLHIEEEKINNIYLE